MKKSIGKKLLGGISGVAVLASAGCAAEAPQNDAAATAAVVAQTEDTGMEYTLREEGEFDTMANVQGDFSFNQDVVTPSDEVFSIFGTVATGMCAKPAYALDSDEALETRYININGTMRPSYAVNLAEKARVAEKEEVMSCTCAMGGGTVNAKVTGVRIEDILDAEDLLGANAITVRGSDGYGMTMPLSYVLDKQAMIAYQVNDEDIPSGTQLWMPNTVAKYFTRDVVEIDLSAEENLPEVDLPADRRAQVSILNHAEDCEVHVGDTLTFEGYADDCGSAVEAVEFSMDGGTTWTSYATEGADAIRWVYWTFSYVPSEVGDYQMIVRARTVDGTVSPLSATVNFTVLDAEN